MNHADDIKAATKLLKMRLDELKRQFVCAMQLSESEGKSAVIRYLSSEFDAIPIEQGNNVLIGSKLVRFNDKGEFIDFNDDSQSESVAVSKPSSDNDCDG